MNNLWQKLRQRKMAQWAGAYVAAAWALLQVLELAADSYGWPSYVMQTAIGAAVLFFLVTLLLAWYHGERGAQKVSGTELLILALLLAIGGGLLATNFRGDSAPSQAAGPENTTPLTTDAKSVAVLPFIDLTQSGDNAWFVDGLTEEILNSLSQLSDLKVIARTSSFQFKEQDRDIRAIAKTLGVANIVEGSVRRSGDQLRVTAQLIRASDGVHLWSDTYDRSAEDVFDVQRDVAEKIAATLDVFLDKPKRERMFSVGTQKVEAFKAFQQAQALFGKAHSGDAVFRETYLAKATEFFDRALEIDPQFARAALSRSDFYGHRLLDGPNTDYELSQQQALDHLLADLDFAVANTSDPFHKMVAEINREFFSPSWYRMQSLLDQVESQDIEQTEVGTTIWLQEILMLSGRLDLARRIVERDLATNPLFYYDPIQLEIVDRNYARALQLIDESRAQTGDSISLRLAEIMIHWLKGEREQTLDLLRAQIGADSWFPAALAAIEGRYPEANRLAEEAAAGRDWPNVMLLVVYNETGDHVRSRALVQRIDALPAGSVILGRFIAGSVLSLPFDLNDAPNFSMRLQQAGFDMKNFPPLPRLSQGGQGQP